MRCGHVSFLVPNPDTLSMYTRNAIQTSHGEELHTLVGHLVCVRDIYIFVHCEALRSYTSVGNKNTCSYIDTRLE